jgi:hypothetical protein
MLDAKETILVSNPAQDGVKLSIFDCVSGKLSFVIILIDSLLLDNLSFKRLFKLLNCG